MNIKKIISLPFLFVALHAQAATITFDPPPCSTCAYLIDEIYEAGYVVSATAHYGMGSAGAYNSSTGAISAFVIAPFTNQSIIDLQRVDGGAFSLHSIDLAEFSSFLAGQHEILVSGYTNSGIVQQSFTLDGLFGGLDTFETFHLSSAFTGLSYVTIEGVDGASFSADNFVVSQIPLPAAFWFFLSGVASLAGASRVLKI